MAAAHLLQGDYTDRPKRALMVNAYGSDDFVKDFCAYENAPDAAPHLVDLLCTSLVFDEKKQASKALGTKIWNAFTRLRRLAEGCIEAVEEPTMELDNTRELLIQSARPINHRTELPILIIDDLAKSKANANFVARLYTRAHSLKISVLILTKDADWATEMKDINGGIKILPVDGVISNPRGDNIKPFVDDPQWTGMTWTLQDLKLFATKLGPPDVSTELEDGMTPQEVSVLHARKLIDVEHFMV